MTEIAWLMIGIPVGLFLYAYLAYPGLLAIFAPLGRVREAEARARVGADWPFVSISLPVYNEEAVIRETLEAWLAIDYPRDRVQIVVASDASTDKTNEVVAQFEDRGVELVRLPARGGKTAAENAVAPLLRGDIIINTDASVRVRPDAVEALVRAFADPTVGVASGRDVSVGSPTTDENVGEAGYVGYEMWVRRLETRTGGIIGASGCFYAIRPALHSVPIPEHLSRDFASALTAREHGYRSVSVDDAICLVPRTGSLRAEFRRKVRTMARGLDTLRYKRGLMNPLRYGGFALKLVSHKLCRWLVPLTLPLALAGLLLLALQWPLARVALVAVLLGLAVGGLGYVWGDDRRPPPAIAVLTYAVGANVAALVAWARSFRSRRDDAVWEPTRRATVGQPPGSA